MILSLMYSRDSCLLKSISLHSFVSVFSTSLQLIDGEPVQLSLVDVYMYCTQAISRYRLATAIWWKTSITLGAMADSASFISPMKYVSACSSLSSNRKRSSTFAMIPSASEDGLLDKSSIPASLIRYKRLRTNPALFLNRLKDWHAREQNCLYSWESIPPIPSTIYSQAGQWCYVNKWQKGDNE